MSVYLGLQLVQLAVFALLAGLALNRGLRFRERPSLFMASAFSILALTVLVGVLAPAEPGAAVAWHDRVLFSLLVFFPGCLYLFLASFERPPAPLRIGALLLGGSSFVLVWVISDFGSPSEPRPPLLGLLLVLFCAHWLWTCIGVAVQLWRAGRTLPTSPRLRTHMLAAGISTLALDLLLALAIPPDPSSLTAEVLTALTALIAIVAGALMLLGLAPPLWLARMWRGADNAVLNEALSALPQADSPEEVAAVLLPSVRTLMGASGARLLDEGGEVLALTGTPPDGPGALGSPDDGTAASESSAELLEPGLLRLSPTHLRVELTHSFLDLWLSPYTPFFGRDELAQLRSLAALTELALSQARVRSALAASASELAEAQRIAQLGSWRWEEGSDFYSWSEQMSALHELPHDPAGPEHDAVRAMVHPEDMPTMDAQFALALETGQSYEQTYRLLLPSGSTRWVHTRVRVPVATPGSRVVVGTCQDISEEVALRERLTTLALSDALTALPNRALLTDRLSQALSLAAPSGSSLALLLLDVDRFKVINDSLGHGVGDLTLVELSRRLSTLLSPGDTLARLSGDEFAILLPTGASADSALELAARVQEAARVPLSIQGSDLVVSFSCGIRLVGPSEAFSLTAAAVVQDADLALYRAKSAGPSRSLVFDDSMRRESVDRLDLELELRRALDLGELEMFYQPQVLLSSGALTGWEALVRWNHPSRGLVAPDAFIPVAEETGLIQPLGEWVLRSALAQLALWQSAIGSAELTMAVNLSALQLAEPGFMDVLSSALVESGLDPASVELEITESVLMARNDAVHEVLLAIHELGIKLSVDDFGTGYSSLAYLKRFPIDAVKVDRAFTAGLNGDVGDHAIVAAIIAMASAMEMNTVAEGVETSVQLQHLVSLGCTRAQGYLFGRPASVAQNEHDLAGFSTHMDTLLPAQRSG